MSKNLSQDYLHSCLDRRTKVQKIKFFPLNLWPYVLLSKKLWQDYLHTCLDRRTEEQKIKSLLWCSFVSCLDRRTEEQKIKFLPLNLWTSVLMSKNLSQDYLHSCLDRRTEEKKIKSLLWYSFVCCLDRRTEEKKIKFLPLHLWPYVLMSKNLSQDYLRTCLDRRTEEQKFRLW